MNTYCSPIVHKVETGQLVKFMEYSRYLHQGTQAMLTQETKKV